MFKNQIFIFLCVFVFLQINVSAQSLLVKIPFEEQIEKASLIVEGKVIEREAYFSSINNRIYTVNKVQVFRVFKGEQQDFINVVTKGGSIDFKKEEVTPSLQLRKNSMGVFMLQPEINQFEDFNTLHNTYHVYSDLQGFYKYDEYENSVSNPYYSFSGIQDLFYTSLTDITNVNIELDIYNFPFQSQRAAKGLVSNNITSFTPQEVRSGTDDIVTITGTDFGSSIGSVQFKNADNGGLTFENAFDSAIQSWSNDSIIIRVPSFAGTGNIQIITAEGNRITSSEELTVLSSELNSEFSGEFAEQDFRSKLFNSDNQGGYTWVFNEDFYQNSDAVAAFERAIDSWVCATGISWIISENQSVIDGTDDDGLNIVSFKRGNDNNFDEIEPGILAVTSTYYLGCANGDTVTSYVAEVDMTFNSDFDWHYGEDDPNTFENDFQGTATHELGHAHNLGHVIAPTNLMHFETAAGQESATRDIDEDSVIGAALNYEFSKTPGLCGEDAVIDRNCEDDSVIVDYDDNLVVVENPVRDTIKLAIDKADAFEYSFFLYDMSGRVVVNELLTNASFDIDVSFLEEGVYIAKVIADDEIRVQKIIKL